jgi:hypothetical protein
MGLTIVDGNKPAGRIVVQLYPYACQGFERPHFDVVKGDRYYNLFHDHFLKLWEKANPYNFTDQDVQSTTGV